MSSPQEQRLDFPWRIPGWPGGGGAWLPPRGAEAGGPGVALTHRPVQRAWEPPGAALWVVRAPTAGPSALMALGGGAQARNGTRLHPGLARCPPRACFQTRTGTRPHQALRAPWGGGSKAQHQPGPPPTPGLDFQARWGRRTPCWPPRPHRSTDLRRHQTRETHRRPAERKSCDEGCSGEATSRLDVNRD